LSTCKKQTVLAGELATEGSSEMEEQSPPGRAASVCLPHLYPITADVLKLTADVLKRM